MIDCIYFVHGFEGVGDEKQRRTETFQFIYIRLQVAADCSILHSRMNVGPLTYRANTQNGNQLIYSVHRSSVYKQRCKPPVQWKHTV